ncbi:hypothetical protein [Planctellipticum variicoloris]
MQVETDRLEAVISDRSPEPWMTGIEKGPFSTKPPASAKSGAG